MEAEVRVASSINRNIPPPVASPQPEAKTAVEIRNEGTDPVSFLNKAALAGSIAFSAYGLATYNWELLAVASGSSLLILWKLREKTP